MRKLELLAPAKNLECGKAAIDHGADAVYIGATRFGARAAAGNSVEDIAELCRYAHLFGAKVYVTVNTIVYDSELEKMQQLISQLKDVGTDAFLIQDMGILQQLSYASPKMLNPSFFHASTQTDNRTVEKVRWLQSLGFSRVVLARELSLEEIREIHEQVPGIELEVFVHGALCVSYSGLCYASQHCFGRSANRGECAQMCRMKYNLVDSTGNELIHQRYLLSLKDLCRIDDLEKIADAGAVSFKIEGRLKDVSYVKNVVSAYSQRLDSLVRKRPNDYMRSSLGRVQYFFKPDLRKTFNRGFTDYFLHCGRDSDGRLLNRQADIISPDTPKAMGEYVGKVKEISRNSFSVAGTASFANGDGLCFLNAKRELEGFRVNRVEGNRLYPDSRLRRESDKTLSMSLPPRTAGSKIPASLLPGMALYRNQDVAFEKILAGRGTAERKIPVTIRFHVNIDNGRGGSDILLDVNANDIGVSIAVPSDIQVAHTSQKDKITGILSKLGNTPFICEGFDGNSDFKWFVPASKLTEARRYAVSVLEEKISQSTSTGTMTTEPKVDVNVPIPVKKYDHYPYLFNIANRQAKAFYESKGLQSCGTAFELARPREALLMQCRHCLRYTLGACVRHGGRKPTWREPLFLELSDRRRFRLEFNCKDCQMNVYAE